MSEKARAIGKDFEGRLDWLHSRYRAFGIAIVWRFPTGCRMLGPNHWVPQKTRPDYVGNIMPVGRAVSFDAKSTSGKYGWTPGRDRDRVWRQAEDMLAFQETGGISFFLVEHRLDDGSEFWLVRPDAVAEVASPVGAMSIKWRDIENVATRVPTCLWDDLTPNWAVALATYLGEELPELARLLEEAKV